MELLRKVAALPEVKQARVASGVRADLALRDAEALAAFDQGLARFPDATEFRVFRAMTCYNLGRNKEGMETLLGILATTTTDPALFPYRHAMALYAEDLDKRW